MNRVIAFTAPKIAELQHFEIPIIKNDKDVLVRMEYTVISGGTEKANLLHTPHVSPEFPKYLGYCGIGKVIDVGEAVTTVKRNDRVLVYHGRHADYNVRPEKDITLIKDERIDSLEAAFTIIAAMGLGGTRKLEIELGESAMVMGLGLLGIFALQFCHLSGAYPVIAADPNEERRNLALSLGADYAFNPTDEEFAVKIKNVTGGKGINACVEVTGYSVAMKQALECAAYMGRVSLLGCTRVSDCNIDYYTMVHRPGIKLIGAHNFVRPKVESYPHHWTHQDDCNMILDFISAGKLKVKPIISRVVKPEECSAIFTELCENPKFPIGTVFDWRD